MLESCSVPDSGSGEEDSSSGSEDILNQFVPGAQHLMHGPPVHQVHVDRVVRRVKSDGALPPHWSSSVSQSLGVAALRSAYYHRVNGSESNTELVKFW